MGQGVTVEPRVEQGVPVLEVSYHPELMFAPEAKAVLVDAFIEAYRSLLEDQAAALDTSSCVIHIQSDVAGSPVVHALYALWQEVVEKRSGQIVCVGYPAAYIRGLTTIGVTSLPGFARAGSVEEAVRMAVSR